jgi:hypothetical protein
MYKLLPMGKSLMLLLFFIGILGSARAQKGDNQLKLLAEAAFPAEEYNTGSGLGDYRTGPGVYAKFLYGVGRKGHLSLTAGFAQFANETFGSIPVCTIPVLAGYRLPIRSFYLEPQVGYGILSGHDWDDVDRRFVRYNTGTAYFSLGGGYDYNRWDAGLRFQSSHTVGRPASRYFQFVGVHVGYALWQKTDQIPSP